MTYLTLAALFVLACAPVLLVAAAVRRPSRRWWAATGLTCLALVVLTAVFDTAMIAADLFRFDESKLIGLHVGLAPVEDFAWPIAAVMVVPAVALLLTPRPRHREGVESGSTVNEERG